MQSMEEHCGKYLYVLVPQISARLTFVSYRFHLVQGWANFFVGWPNEKSKMSGGPT
jgi:hypothetical protein